MATVDVLTLAWLNVVDPVSFDRVLPYVCTLRTGYVWVRNYSYASGKLHVPENQ